MRRKNKIGLAVGVILAVLIVAPTPVAAINGEVHADSGTVMAYNGFYTTYLGEGYSQQQLQTIMVICM